MTQRVEHFLEQPLPNAEQQEKAVLGSVFINLEVLDKLEAKLVPAEFYHPLYRRVYETMLLMKERGKAIDPLTVTDNFREIGVNPESYGGIVTISDLTYGLPWVGDNAIDEYIAEIKKASILRRIITLTNSVQRDVLVGDDSAEIILRSAEEGILKLGANLKTVLHPDQSGPDYADLREIAKTLKTQFDNYRSGQATGIPTGMLEVDEALDGGGLQPSGLYVVGGKQKHGKTALVLGWAEHCAMILRKRVAVVNLEMSKETLSKRLFSAYTGISYSAFRPGFGSNGTENLYAKAIDALNSFADIPITIADKVFTLAHVRQFVIRVMAQAAKNNEEFGFLVVDYLQLLQGGQGRSKEEEISNISTGLKRIASELGIPIVALTNMNRAKFGTAEAGTAEEPDVDSFRYSGQIAFDAEAAFILHDPLRIQGKPYEQKAITDMVLIIPIQRNGPTARIPVKLIGRYMQFMTESEYKFHFGDTSEDKEVPETKGQLFTRTSTDDWADVEEDDEDDWT